VFWQFMTTSGRVPMKDFFYPYGLQYLFAANAPWGVLITYTSFMAFWVYVVFGTFFVLSRYFASGALVRRFSFVAAILAIGALTGDIPLQARYAGSLGVVLLFAGIDADTPTLAPRRILFAVGLAHLVLFEMAQVAYAALPILLLAVVEVLRFRVRGRRAFVSWASRTLATLAVPIGVGLAILASLKELGGTVAFYSQFRALDAAWGAVSQIDQWISHPNGLAGFVYWAATISLMLGVWGVLTTPGRLRSAHATVAAVGLLAFMMLQKNVLRQGIESEIWLPAVYGLVLWIAVVTQVGFVRHRVAAAVTVGSLTALTVASGGLSSGLGTLAHGPARMARSVASLATDREAFSVAARTRFAPFRFAHHPTDLSVARVLRHDPAVAHGGRVWIMGDDVGVEILLGRTSPYYFNTFWETSPVAWQRKLVRQLMATPPAVAVWNPQESQFDGVPNLVRVPLVFDWAIKHLTPREQVGSFEILRPRRAGEPIQRDWWRRRLGSSLDLGRLPESIRVGKRPCSVGPDCRSYAIVSFAKETALPPEVSLSVLVNRRVFRVMFGVSPQQQRYVIDLDRLWFWHDAPVGAHRVVNPSVEGATVEVVRRRADPHSLY
jgi:hypothetical protein